MSETGVIDLPELADLPVNDMGPLKHIYQVPRSLIDAPAGTPALCGHRKSKSGPLAPLSDDARWCATCLRIHRENPL